jgi:hypothetical protein
MYREWKWSVEFEVDHGAGDAWKYIHLGIDAGGDAVRLAVRNITTVLISMRDGCIKLPVIAQLIIVSILVIILVDYLLLVILQIYKIQYYTEGIGEPYNAPCTRH